MNNSEETQKTETDSATRKGVLDQTNIKSKTKYNNFNETHTNLLKNLLVSKMTNEKKSQKSLVKKMT